MEAGRSAQNNSMVSSPSPASRGSGQRNHRPRHERHRAGGPGRAGPASSPSFPDAQFRVPGSGAQGGSDGHALGRASHGASDSFAATASTSTSHEFGAGRRGVEGLTRRTRGTESPLDPGDTAALARAPPRLDRSTGGRRPAARAAVTVNQPYNAEHLGAADTLRLGRGERTRGRRQEVAGGRRISAPG